MRYSIPAPARVTRGFEIAAMTKSVVREEMNSGYAAVTSAKRSAPKASDTINRGK